MGCGFLFAVDGDVLATLAAHCVRLGDEQRPLLRILLSIPGEDRELLELKALHGPPGRRRVGRDLRLDYLLLEVPQPVPRGLVLQPDRRGAPLVGERVWLYSGAGDGPARYQGVVYAVDEYAAWVVMEEGLDPAGMSGSPLISARTGKVVGMAVAAGWQQGRAVVGMHPIGSLVAKARASEGALLLEDLTP
jgi:hypothetical protein